MSVVDMDAPRAIAARAGLTLLAMMVGGGLLVAALRAFRKKPKGAAPTAAPGVPLLTRYLTLMALIVVVIGPAFLGGYLFVASVVAIATLGVREIFDAFEPTARASRVTAMIAAAAIVVSAALGGVAAIGPALAVSFVILAATCLFEGVDRLGARAGAASLAVIYLGACSAFMVLLRTGPGGFGRYLYFLVVIQMADLGGLFGGMALGKHKITPVLSPGKTWEGTISSFVVAALGGALFAFAMPEIGTLWSALMALPLAATGLLGDLFASGLKRSVGLKDFGALLPGHGGVLDRFDSYLVSAPVAWAVFTLLTP